MPETLSPVFDHAKRIDRPLISSWHLSVGQLNELLDLADFPEVGAAIRVRVRNIVREVFDMHTRPRCQKDKWSIFREKIVEIYPPLRKFPHRIEALEAYARRNAIDQISRRMRLEAPPTTFTTDKRRHESGHQTRGTRALVHDRQDHSLIIQPTSSPIRFIRSSYCEEIPTQGRVDIPTCSSRCYMS